MRSKWGAFFFVDRNVTFNVSHALGHFGSPYGITSTTYLGFELILIE
jgi:hypothetical protein